MPIINVRWRPARWLASLPLTVAGLLLMSLLVIGGTIYQAEKGIYAAQQEIFQAWIFWLFDALPLPGMLLAGVLLFVNLLSALLFRLKTQRSGWGLLWIHLGLLVLLSGGFINSLVAGEYFLTLRAGESSQTASAAHEWELALWTQQAAKKLVVAVDTADLRPGRPWPVANLDLQVTLLHFFGNCRPESDGSGARTGFSQLPSAHDPAENTPGATIEIRSPQNGTRTLQLFGADENPAAVLLSGRQYHLALRLKRIVLPLRIKLVDFKKTMHPGSAIPKSFVSRVEISGNGLRREVLISMNRPFRFRQYTFYQSGYGEDPQRGTSSTFSVMKNAGRWLPYIASALIFLGLAWHFLSQMLTALKKTPNEVKP